MEERIIILDPLRHGTILRRIKVEFGVICILRGQDNEYVSHCKPIFNKLCAGEPVSVSELQDLLSEIYHPLLRPLKSELTKKLEFIRNVTETNNQISNGVEQAEFL